MGKLSHGTKIYSLNYPFNMTKISIAAPAYNERKKILKNCISDWEKSFKSEAVDSYGEIIICNDCSQDKPKNIIEQSLKENDKISLSKP